MQQEAIRIERYDLFDQNISEDLSIAFLAGESINPEFGLDWLRHLARSIQTESEIAYLYAARGATGEFLVLPALSNRQTRKITALSNFYTSLFTTIEKTDRPSALLRSLFHYLRQKEGMSTITLSPLIADNQSYDNFVIALEQAGWSGIHSWRCFLNWTHSVSESNYAEYLAARPSILRNTIIRKKRKFLAAGRGQLTLYTGMENIDECTAHFQSVYRRSWKQAEPHSDFIPGLIQLAGQKKWLRLAVAYYDGEAIAAQLWLVSNGTAAIFKLAYDEAFKQLSPGTLLSAFLMERVIDVDRVTKIDYLSGNDSYKESWMTQRKERRGLAAYNTRTARGMALYVARQAKQLLKKKTMA